MIIMSQIISDDKAIVEARKAIFVPGSCKYNEGYAEAALM